MTWPMGRGHLTLRAEEGPAEQGAGVGSREPCFRHRPRDVGRAAVQDVREAGWCAGPGPRWAWHVN